jgi:hypothetical protein
MTPKFPTVSDITRFCDAVKADIGGEIESICVTIGVDGNGGWAGQTGDNSFVGPAYGFPFWGVSEISADTDTRAVARDLHRQVSDLWFESKRGEISFLRE